jgi:hypothetical protein
MIEKPTDDEMTCKHIDDEAFLDEYALSEEFHDFGDANEELITDLSFCEVMFVEERCSYCSALLRGVAIRGDPPETMKEYKRLLYDVYEAFYANPRSHDHITLSQGLVDASREIQIEIQSTLSQVIAHGCDDAGDVAAKQSRQELWTQTLGPEPADTQ